MTSRLSEYLSEDDINSVIKFIETIRKEVNTFQNEFQAGMYSTMIEVQNKLTVLLNRSSEIINLKL